MCEKVSGCKFVKLLVVLETIEE